MRMNCTHMPADWVPPADAFVGTWSRPGTLVMAVFGAQGSAAPLLAWMRETMRGEYAPFELCHGRFTDSTGCPNRIAIAYWNSDAFPLWWNSPGVADWWRDPARAAEGGVWREFMQVPPERRETLFSERFREGFARSAETLDGPIQEHGYWGAARDRIPLSAQDALAGGLCVIRSGQDWSDCAGEERAHYLDAIRPVLERGMQYLIDEPAASHCHCCRMIRVCDEDGNDLDKSFALASFADLRYLEAWARDHPTHHAIFGGFLAMVARFGAGMRLRLWHEVFVLGDEAADVEYIGCHARTGLLAAL
jgi:aldoxime dehydratase